MIAIFLDAMAAGKETKIFGDGRRPATSSTSADVVRATLAAAGHEGGVFNVGTGVETSVAELHAACRRVTGYEREPKHGPARPGDVLRSVIDPSLAERELGWRPEHELEDGLRLTWPAVAGAEA